MDDTAIDDFIKTMTSGYKVITNKDGILEDPFATKLINDRILLLRKYFQMSFFYLKVYLETNNILFKHLALSIQLYCRDQMVIYFTIRNFIISSLTENISESIDSEELLEQGVDIKLFLQSGGVRKGKFPPVQKNKKRNPLGLVKNLWKLLLFLASLGILSGTGASARPTPGQELPTALQLYEGLPTTLTVPMTSQVASMTYGPKGTRVFSPENPYMPRIHNVTDEFVTTDIRGNIQCKDPATCRDTGNRSVKQVFKKVTDTSAVVYSKRDLETVEHNIRVELQRPPVEIPTALSGTQAEVLKKIEPDPRDREIDWQVEEYEPISNPVQPRPDKMDIGWLESALASLGLMTTAGVLNRTPKAELVDAINTELANVYNEVEEVCQEIAADVETREIFNELTKDNPGLAMGLRENIKKATKNVCEFSRIRVATSDDQVSLTVTGRENWQQGIENYTLLLKTLIEKRIKSVTDARKPVNQYEITLLQRIKDFEALVIDIDIGVEDIVSQIPSGADITDEALLIKTFDNAEAAAKKLLATTKRALPNLKSSVKELTTKRLKQGYEELGLNEDALRLAQKKTAHARDFLENRIIEDKIETDISKQFFRYWTNRILSPLGGTVEGILENASPIIDWVALKSGAILRLFGQGFLGTYGFICATTALVGVGLVTIFGAKNVVKTIAIPFKAGKALILFFPNKIYCYIVSNNSITHVRTIEPLAPAQAPAIAPAIAPPQAPAIAPAIAPAQALAIAPAEPALTFEQRQAALEAEGMLGGKAHHSKKHRKHKNHKNHKNHRTHKNPKKHKRVTRRKHHHKNKKHLRTFKTVSRR